MGVLLRLITLLGVCAALSSCATAPGPAGQTGPPRIQKVRTTAYTHNEGGSGTRNALGKRLSGGRVKSAASDWSRFPIGTHFRVLKTGEEYMIDDYGGAMVGTNTIDLYKTSRAAMRRWGVRHVEIEILQWGSEQESLKVLRPRRKIARVRRMIASLEKKRS